MDADERGGADVSIGLVGCGRWGSNILRDLRQLGCQVQVVARSLASRDRAREGGAASVVERIDQLPTVQGIVVASLTASHAAVAEACLERNVPIFVEKPLTADRASAVRLAQLAPDRIFVMDKWRYHPGIEALAQIARTEELGPVLGLRTIRMNWGNPHPDVDGVWILAPHDLAVCLEIFGHLPRPRIAVATIEGRVATGLFATLGAEPWCLMDVSTRHRAWRREFCLYCRDGVAMLDDAYAGYMQITRVANVHDVAAPLEERRAVSPEWPLVRELRAFVEHLQGGPPPKSSAAEGAAIVDALATLRELAGIDAPRRAA
jgi:predicted dehydrogenase